MTTSAQRNLASSMKWGRKLVRWDDAPEIPSYMVQKLVAAEIPRFHPADIYDEPIEALPETSFRTTAEVPQIFWLVNEDAGRIFLIDTQGYDYARYAVRLK